MYTPENSLGDLKVDLWKTIFLYNPVVFRFHVHLPECMFYMFSPFLKQIQVLLPASIGVWTSVSKYLGQRVVGMNQRGRSLMDSASPFGVQFIRSAVLAQLPYAFHALRSR